MSLMRQSLPSDFLPMKVWPDKPDFCMEVYQHQIPDNSEDSGIQYRMEAHVDQRYTAIMAVESKVTGSVGRLVIAHNVDAKNTEEINESATFVNHTPGSLICFPKGTQHPHYSEAINPGDRRTIVSLNYALETETDTDAATIVTYNNGQVVE